VIMILLVIMGAFGPLMAPHDPTETGVVKKYRGPAWDGNLLGGDRFGRDVLSRLLHGARVSLIVGVGASVAGCLFGAGMGLVAGYAGGKTDYALERVTDIILAFPVIILAMALLSGLPRTIPTIILAIAIPTAPFCGRVVRATALVIKESQYIEAARAIGSNPWRIIFLHVAPGCFAPFLVITTSLIGAAILTEAFLGFLGLSVAPPQPTWGEMLAKATTELTFAAHLSIAPGIMITLAVFAFNVLGDTMRDLLDPRLRGKV
jgi:ABC-type dipeptide/oligopeptide/nickel transport system permease subunit